MNKKPKEKPVWLIALIVGVGNVLVYAPPYIHLILAITAIIALSWEFFRDLKREHPINQRYVYFTGFSSMSLFLLYILCENYLNVSKNITYWLVGLGVLFIISGIIMGILSRLKSGDQEQVRKAKFGIVLMSIIFILITSVVVGIINIS